MKRVVKIILYGLGILILVLLMAALFFSSKFNREFEKVITFEPVEVIIPQDSVSIERGRILSVDCRSCHGPDLAGKVFFDDPTIGTLPSSNLTRAKGSETEHYTNQDFVKAIRHGLNKAGNRLMVMPCKSTSQISDKDLGCLIAFINTLPKVENTFPKRKFAFTAQIMAGAGLFGDLFHYDLIDHEITNNIKHIPEGSTEEYGHYLTSIHGCNDCHKKDLKGGKSPDPVSPPVPDISRTGNFGKWTQEQFISVFRTGKTPEGKILDGNFMPFAGLGAHSDEEIAAVYNYIKNKKD
ncbi:MAG: cytochrome c [Saprospiraceae bacterium]|nr:cytochrome c [Saprospiraceae bacterium]MBK6785920.1 cytochrome c [Saprospiraceae bacterium]MBK7523723.1 cytochrome c [Saprospiraceae bacterium]MBK8373239.1 cytochrome c [Saprospiraceae bacterium]MBK8545920.1 cytochrome c [Saprospiraceae bacterium]